MKHNPDTYPETSSRVQTIGPFRLAPWFSPRPWGSVDLAPWYPGKREEPIGEAWLTGRDCIVESGCAAGWTLGKLVDELGGEMLLGNGAGSGDFPLLTKLLFPRAKLSVQVHPDDCAAQSAGERCGKTECWYVLSADAGASVALGLLPDVSERDIREAIASHTLERLLDWVPVSAGDMIYVDAGTVHSIGPGVVLLEIQQYSDVTYRLYDYGRPRELHLELGLRALKLKTGAGKVRAERYEGYDRLISKQYFVVERHTLAAGEDRQMQNWGRTAQVLVSLSGSATLKVRGTEPLELLPGRAVVIPAAVAEYSLDVPHGMVCIRAMPPGTVGLD